jgi:hypothetical protein
VWLMLACNVQRPVEHIDAATLGDCQHPRAGTLGDVSFRQSSTALNQRLLGHFSGARPVSWPTVYRSATWTRRSKPAPPLRCRRKKYLGIDLSVVRL